MRTIYAVKYFDARMSKRGQGVQVRRFWTRSEAEEFAGRNRLYGKPCQVVEESEEVAAQSLDSERMARVDAMTAVFAARLGV